MHSVAIAMVVTWPLSGYCVGKSYLLPEVIICCHGNGSDERHMCSGHMHYYQATMLVIA